jgi:hypothetical protein
MSPFSNSLRFEDKIRGSAPHRTAMLPAKTTCVRDNNGLELSYIFTKPIPATFTFQEGL